MNLKHGWIAALAAASFSVSAHANLVVNGGFETGDFSSWTRSGNPDYTDVDSSAVHSGTYAAYFGPVGTGGMISQELATTPGQTYKLSFWLANEGSDEGSNAFLVDWDGAYVTSLSFSPGFEYRQSTFQLVATDSTTTLTFAFRNDPSYWDFDDVSVTAVEQPDPSVPAPSVLALLGIGVFGLARTRRRKA